MRRGAVPVDAIATAHWHSLGNCPGVRERPLGSNGFPPQKRGYREGITAIRVTLNICLTITYRIIVIAECECASGSGRPTGASAASARSMATRWATKCNIRHRRIVICVVFLSPSRRLRRPRSHLSRAPPTYRRFPCNRAKNIRDNIRYKRVDPRPTISITRYRT